VSGGPLLIAAGASLGAGAGCMLSPRIPRRMASTLMGTGCALDAVVFWDYKPISAIFGTVALLFIVLGDGDDWGRRAKRAARLLGAKARTVRSRMVRKMPARQRLRMVPG
jgi:hypothetical protein